MPSARNLNEFMFLSSVLVPSSVDPAGRSETLASQRIEPFSMSQSDTPIVRSVLRSSARNATACSGERRSGSVTISTSGVPQRLKSTSETLASAIRPPRRRRAPLRGVLLEVGADDADPAALDLEVPAGSQIGSSY